MAVNAHSIASAVLIVMGTWFISVNVFEASVQRTVNFKKEKRPPWLVAIFLFLFGYGKQYDSGDLWAGEKFPSSDDSSLCAQFKIVSPLLGFVLIVVGVILQLFV